VELNERSVAKPGATVERNLAIRVAPPPPAVIPPTRQAQQREMWTEITKDLVTKEGIESMGYAYEETDEFFYVMEYLRYVSGCFGFSRFFSSLGLGWLDWLTDWLTACSHTGRRRIFGVGFRQPLCRSA